HHLRERERSTFHDRLLRRKKNETNSPCVIVQRRSEPERQARDAPRRTYLRKGRPSLGARARTGFPQGSSSRLPLLARQVPWVLLLVEPILRERHSVAGTDCQREDARTHGRRQRLDGTVAQGDEQAAIVERVAEEAGVVDALAFGREYLEHRGARRRAK